MIILKPGKCIKMHLKNYLISVTNSFKNQEMCNKAADNYPHALEFVSDCYMCDRVIKLYDKVVNTHSSAIEFVPECCKAQKKCDNDLNESFLAYIF